MIVTVVPGIVNFLLQLQQTHINVIWQVGLFDIMLVLCTPSFQPPPLIAGFPVLHYVVSYNTSDNSTLIHTQVNSSMTSYSVSGVPGVTYYITVFAVNALGPGPIDKYTTVNGEIMIITITINNFIYHAVSMFPTTTTTNTQLVVTQSIVSIIYIIVPTAQDSPTST